MTDLFSSGDTGDPPIAGFFGEFRFISNFWPAKVVLDEVSYPSVENAYQAAKTDTRLREPFVSCTASQSKRLGRDVVMRADWNGVKLDVMRDLIAQKFAPGTALAAQLMDTNQRLLVEANTWGDTFWGQCGGKGQNHLGRLLMVQRSALHAQSNCLLTTERVALRVAPVPVHPDSRFRFR